MPKTRVLHGTCGLWTSACCSAFGSHTQKLEASLGTCRCGVSDARGMAQGMACIARVVLMWSMSSCVEALGDAAGGCSSHQPSCEGIPAILLEYSISPLQGPVFCVMYQNRPSALESSPNGFSTRRFLSFSLCIVLLVCFYFTRTTTSKRSCWSPFGNHCRKSQVRLACFGPAGWNTDNKLDVS